MSGIIFMRGAGDMATGSIVRLSRCGFRVLAAETERPSAIRRRVSLSDAVYAGAAEVEGVVARLIALPQEAEAVWQSGEVPLLIDPDCESLDFFRPAALVDATLSKRNIGTHREMAPAVVALGPGFTAGEDVHAVVETKRGHDLGRVLWQGAAAANTGIPGVVGGYSKERVIHAPVGGDVHIIRDIGSHVEAGEVIAEVSGVPVRTVIPGVLRGMIREGFRVRKDMKMADVDPRPEAADYCESISDKSRAVAGGVLEALMALGLRP